MTIHKRLVNTLFPALVLLTAPLACSWAQTSEPSARSFHQVALSPDGKRVAWVETAVNSQGEATGGTAIYIQELDSGSAPKRISAGTENSALSEDSLSWSPDSRHLAFLSDAETQSELYVASIEGGSARKLTNLTGFLANPAWAPDGKSIAFLFTENAPRAAGPLMPMTTETGVIESKVYEQRLAVVDLRSGQVRQLSPPDMYVYEYDWSPDGKTFAMTAAHGEGDTNWYVAQLYTLSADSSDMKAIYKPLLQIAVPRWSPEGKSIAFIAGLMSDEGVTGGDIFSVPAGGGEARNLTPGIAASPSSIHWTGDRTILFAETIDGETGLASVDVANGKVFQLWAGPELIKTDLPGMPDISLSADGKTSAITRQSTLHPPDVWAGPIGQWKQLTHANDNMHPDWGEMKSLHWKNGEMTVQGWLLYPKDYDASRRYPMVVVVHGGPAGVSYIEWPSAFFNTFNLSAHGYFVLYPNPRGSFGEGEAFTRANVKDFGYGDFHDILAGVEEVIKTAPVDSDRVGITGWSYGGYMTMWAVTQTHRFRAAMAGAGLSDWLSYYGENDIDDWMPPYFGASVYDDPAIYARSAPMTFIKNAKTPTLVLVGDRDGECPAPQSREFWYALKTFGVDTELVIYPGEGHSFLQLDHQRDVMDRTIGWFDHYLKTAQGPVSKAGD